jgi:hypothetical protein
VRGDGELVTAAIGVPGVVPVGADHRDDQAPRSNRREARTETYRR